MTPLTPHGIKIAAYSRRPRQPSPRKNQCSRQDKHPTGAVPPTDQGEGVSLPFFFSKGRPISGSCPHWFLRAGDQVATLVVTRSATAPQHSNHPLPTAPTCSTSNLPVVVFIVQAVPPLTEAQGQRQPSVTAATFLFAEAPGL